MKIEKHFFLLLICVLLWASSCQNKKETTPPIPEKINKDTIDWGPARAYYLGHIQEAIAGIDSLKKLPQTGTQTEKQFALTHISFKKAEPYGSYLNPEVGHRANGPALPIVTDDSQKILPPLGLQKIEENIFDGGEDPSRHLKDLEIVQGLLRNLEGNIKDRELNAQRFFLSTHQQLMRIASLSTAGFDTPVSGLSINEIAVSLRSLFEVYELSIAPVILTKNNSLHQEFLLRIQAAAQYVDQNTDFESFDRFVFLRNYFNPVTRKWVEIRQVADIWDPVKSQAYNYDAPTFFEKNSFNLNFFTPTINRNPSAEQIELGRKLFFDPKVSAGNDMACATCHNPSKAWADGLALNVDNQGNPLQRNTPTLLNAAFQRSFFWDGRSPNILDQISLVFNNEKEFNNSVHQFSEDIVRDSTYAPLFEKAFEKTSSNNREIIRAISSYISTLNAFDSKFDRNIRGEEDTFTEEEKLGFNLYMGKALCATCHFMPLTNGSVPPFFKEHEKEVIGVPETAANKKLDDDLGFYWRHEQKLDVHKGMFKTPTVRNAELTAPYMHNGVYATLEEVMNFYNLGGGGGMGFDLPHQTLPFDNLNLSEKELKALSAFVKTLTDTKVENGLETY